MFTSFDLSRKKVGNFILFFQVYFTINCGKELGCTLDQSTDVPPCPGVVNEWTPSPVVFCVFGVFTESLFNTF